MEKKPYRGVAIEHQMSGNGAKVYLVCVDDWSTDMITLQGQIKELEKIKSQLSGINRAGVMIRLERLQDLEKAWDFYQGFTKGMTEALA